MSTDRVIHGRDYTLGANSPLCRWLRANGVDPGTVPANSTTTLTGDQLTYESLVPGRNGGFLFEPGQATYLRELRTVPLISPPEAHGL